MAATTIRKFYKGFSTRNYHDSGNEFEIYNIACIEEDLLNHIFTIKGERVHMPDFGTRIPLMVFEINDEVSQSIIEDDLRAVFEYDPRIDLINLLLAVDYDRGILIATATLNYKEFQVTKDLHIEVKSQ